MKTILSLLLWTAVFLLTVLAIDQLLLRLPAASTPPHAAVTFYRDLRARLLDLAGGTPGAPAPPRRAPVKAAPPASIEGVIERHQPRPTAAPAGEGAPRYLYADDRGELHFAETLAEVPEPYRGRAKALGE